MVELSGNVTLGIIAGMLDEISLRHVSAAMVGAHNAMPKAKADRLLRSYSRLVDLAKRAAASRPKPIGEDTWRTLPPSCSKLARRPESAT
jgi:hypothetical protein